MKRTPEELIEFEKELKKKSDEEKIKAEENDAFQRSLENE